MSSHDFSYIKTVLLKSQQIMHMYIWLLEAFSWRKMEVSGHFIDIQETIDIASFAILIFDSLKETLPLALYSAEKVSKYLNSYILTA